jgi:hypothetical protein
MTILFKVGVFKGEFGRTEGRTADPSTALRSGRDDKGEGGASSGDWFVDEGPAVFRFSFIYLSAWLSRLLKRNDQSKEDSPASMRGLPPLNGC